MISKLLLEINDLITIQSNIAQFLLEEKFDENLALKILFYLYFNILKVKILSVKDKMETTFFSI